MFIASPDTLSCVAILELAQQKVEAAITSTRSPNASVIPA
jgi:hypothetical protein